MKAQRNQRGFTLVEIIVVITVIGILASFVVPSYISYVDKTRKSLCENQQKTLVYAFNLNSIGTGGYATATQAMEVFLESSKKTLSIVATDNGRDTCEISGACPNDGIYTVDFTSGSSYTINCSKHGETDIFLLSERTAADSVLNALLDTGASFTGTKLIEEYFATNGNTLTKVSSSQITDVFGSATLTSTDLYWRPNLINNVGGTREYMMYASVGNNNTQSNWSGYIVYYNGLLYKSNGTNYNGTKVTGTNVAMGTTRYNSSADVIAVLLSRGYTEVK